MARTTLLTNTEIHTEGFSYAEGGKEGATNPETDVRRE
jgi:hypothetical protein